MFDLNKFYKQCNNCEEIDMSEVFKYIKSFSEVIIWGAAGMGVAIGKYLIRNGINNFIFWDQRFEELGNVLQRETIAPFSKEYKRDSTLIIYAIPNHVIMGSLLRKLSNAGYKNVVRGDIFYSGTLCPYKFGDTPAAERCWMKGECRSVACQRLQNIIKAKATKDKPGERIDLTYNCFIVNSICNLSCTHCVQMINNYPEERHINIPVENICRDIDLWLNLVDTVGTISVMGGETFMHPHIGTVMKHFSKYENFGFASFPTNGLFPIKPEQLEGVEDKRIIIAFGGYQHIATEKQLEIYEKNVELVKSYGIAYTESRHLPTWIVPSSLIKRNVDEEYMTRKKQGCKMPARNLQVRDGKVHVCDRGVALYAMGKADYPTDYFNLLQDGTLEELRRKFREFDNRKFYYTCGYCGDNLGSAPSALQGRKNIFNPEEWDNQ